MDRRPVSDSRLSGLFSGFVPVRCEPPPSSWSLQALLCTAVSFTFLIFFPFPLRAPKSKLLLLLRAGLCKSNLCNRIVMLSAGICSPQSALPWMCFARVQSQVFRFTLLTLCLHGVSGRERERDMGKITEAVTVRMGLSIRAVQCVYHCSQAGRLLCTSCCSFSQARLV